MTETRKSGTLLNALSPDFTVPISPISHKILRMALPGFDVHQIADNFLMDGGRDEQERVGRKSALHGRVQG